VNQLASPFRRAPSRTDERIKLPQLNQPTPPGRHRVGGGHGAPNKGEWDRRVGRLFDGRLAFPCQGYTYGIHGRGKDQEACRNHSLLGDVENPFRRLSRIPPTPPAPLAQTVTIIGMHRQRLKPREVGRRGWSAVTRCSEKVKLVTERGDFGSWIESCSVAER
jgi:hypothetical protein